MLDAETDAGSAPEMLATILHEVRTPLACLTTTIDVLVSGFLDVPRDELLAHLRRMQRSTTWLQSLLDNLTTAAQLESQQLHLRIEAVSVRECVENSLALVSPLLERAGQSIELSGELDAVLLGDARRIEQVLVNLLTNASKYCDSADPIEISARHVGGRVRVTVSDRGPGIDLDEQRNIFDRYVRGHAARESGATGLGLGLHIVKTLVERHGGRVGVESVPGQGASFWFELPAALARAESPSAMSAVAHAPLRRPRRAAPPLPTSGMISA